MTPGADGFVLPVGTITLLLGDVEGSTQAWEAGDVGVALQRLDAEVDDAIGLQGGVRPVEQGEGDSFVAAFARPSDAVACALEIQRRLSNAPLRLRIGIHTGEVQLRGEANYVGSTVNRAARLRDAGHGGQILISQATRDLVVDRLPPGCQLEDVGEHRLRDLRRPERIWQLAHPNLRRRFPPLRSLDRVPHNLPVQLTTFVGRQRELEEVARLIREHRLVTLTGIGGCGKTRLALEVAARVADDRSGGTWFVDLSAVERAEAVLGTVAAALGVEEAQGADVWAGLTATISEGPTLMVLDNCEHLVSACAELIERLLLAVDSLTVVATSREILGVPGEVAFRVPSLSVPAEDGPPRIAAVAASEAVELFAERARRAEATFAVSDDNAATVGAICRRLDGIPLAIELAAARVRVLTPAQILQGLDECFSLLTGGARTATPRQQTLEASVEWSHDLLSDSEQVVFRRLSVFRGGFTLEAAKAVATAQPVEPHHVLDLVSLLVDKSLVQHRDGRFWMLDTIRQYAELRLAVAAETEAIGRRHRDYFLVIAEADGPVLVGPDHAKALQRLEGDIDNLRAALQWCRDRRDSEEYLRLLVGLKHLWWASGRLSEGHSWTADVEELAADVDPQLRAEAFIAACMTDRSDVSRARLGEAAVSFFETVGDAAATARALAAANLLRWNRDLDFAATAARLERGVELARSAGPSSDRLRAGLLAELARFQYKLGDFDNGLANLDEALVAAESSGDPFVINLASTLRIELLVESGRLQEGKEAGEAAYASSPTARVALSLADGLLALGDVARAEELGEEARWQWNRGGFRNEEAMALALLGRCALMNGEFALAAARSREAAQLASSPPDRGTAMLQLVLVAVATRDVAGARAALDEVRWMYELISALGDVGGVAARARLVRAHVWRAEGQLVEAEREVVDVLRLPIQYGPSAAVALLAGILAELESFEEATRLVAAAERMRSDIGLVWSPYERALFDETVKRLRDAVHTNRFDELWAEGWAMTTNEALTYARRGRGPRNRPSSGWPSLTPAEASVAHLVGQGLSNSAIAERLFISRRTVQTHLTRVFSKLGISSRAELAAVVARREAAEQA